MKKILVPIFACAVALAVIAAGYSLHVPATLRTGMPLNGAIVAGQVSNVLTAVDLTGADYAAIELRARGAVGATGKVDVIWKFAGSSTSQAALMSSGGTLSVTMNGTNEVTAITNVLVGAIPYLVVHSLTNHDATYYATNIALVVHHKQ